MAPIDDAIADLESHGEGETFTITEIADRHGVVRSTLSRRWRGLTGPRSEGYAQQQLLNPQQEDELVRYIRGLTAKSLPPTKHMVRNFASEISGVYIGEAWVTRFLHRHHEALITKWNTAMEERW
jgi:transposase